MPSIHPIKLFPDPVLRNKAAVVIDFGQPLKALLAKMERLMACQPSGIGIAAPQIGVSWQVAIVDVSSRVPNAKRYYLVNPSILEYSDPFLSREGCMSLPEYTAYVKRYNRIRVVWQDEHGNRQEMTAEGIEARCIQHEVDHLNGILFLDKVASLKTEMIPRRSITKT